MHLFALSTRDTCKRRTSAPNENTFSPSQTTNHAACALALGPAFQVMAQDSRAFLVLASCLLLACASSQSLQNSACEFSKVVSLRYGVRLLTGHVRSSQGCVVFVRLLLRVCGVFVKAMTAPGHQKSMKSFAPCQWDGRRISNVHLSQGGVASGG